MEDFNILFSVTESYCRLKDTGYLHITVGKFGIMSNGHELAPNHIFKQIRTYKEHVKKKPT